jgi:uncharacterized protein (DUF1499 family)
VKRPGRGGETCVKRALFFIIAIILVILIALVVLGLYSRSGEAPGLVDGRLAPCPGSDNCVCSEYPDDSAHYVEPIDSDSGAAALQQAIVELGGKIETDAATYVAASFRSKLFGFVDDLEVRIDNGRKLIQVRSASRVGRGDLGVNRKRVERLRQLLRSRSTQN